MFSLFYILGIIYSYSLYLCRVMTIERDAHLHILEGESQIRPTIASMPGEVTPAAPRGGAAGPLWLLNNHCQREGNG